MAARVTAEPPYEPYPFGTLAGLAGANGGADGHRRRAALF